MSTIERIRNVLFRDRDNCSVNYSRERTKIYAMGNWNNPLPFMHATRNSAQRETRTVCTRGVFAHTTLSSLPLSHPKKRIVEQEMFLWKCKGGKNSETSWTSGPRLGIDHRTFSSIEYFEKVWRDVRTIEYFTSVDSTPGNHFSWC